MKPFLGLSLIRTGADFQPLAGLSLVHPPRPKLHIQPAQLHLETKLQRHLRVKDKGNFILAWFNIVVIILKGAKTARKCQTSEKGSKSKQPYLDWRTQEVLQFEATLPDCGFSRYEVCDIIAICTQLQIKSVGKLILVSYGAKIRGTRSSLQKKNAGLFTNSRSNKNEVDKKFEANWPECVAHEKKKNLYPKGGQNVADLKQSK